MDQPHNIPDLGGLAPGQFPRQQFTDYLADKERQRHTAIEPGQSPKDHLVYAISELSVRLEVLEVMVTKLLKESGMDDDSIVAYLELTLGDTPDTIEGAQP